jgi:hypothetical protein
MSGQEGDILFANSMNYKPYKFAHPMLRTAKIPPKTGYAGGDLTITPAGLTTVEWELPAGQGWNPSELKLQFDSAFPALAGAYNYAYEATWNFIGELSLYTKNKMFIVDIIDFQDYMELSRPLKTQFGQDFKCNELRDRLYPSRALGVNTDVPGQRPDGTSASVPFDEKNYLAVGTLNSTTPNQNHVLRFGDIPDTFFSINKMVYFEEPLILRIKFGPGVKAGFTATSPVNPTTGALALAGNITLTNIQLYQDQEKDQETLNALRQITQKGDWKVFIPSVTSWKQELKSTSQNATVTIQPAHGKRLVKILHSVWNSTESANTAYDHHNKGGVKVNRYKTLLDTRPQQDDTIDCTAPKYEDWTFIKRLIKGSILALNREVFQQGWLHIEDFVSFPNYTQPQPLEPIENLLVGRPITADLRFDFQAVTANATYNHKTWAILMRTLSLEKSGNGMCVIKLDGNVTA